MAEFDNLFDDDYGYTSESEQEFDNQEDDQIIPIYPILHSPIQSYLKITNSDNYQKVTYTIAQSCDLYYKMTLEFNVYDFDVSEAKYLGVYWYDGSNYNPLPFYVTNTYGNEYTEPIDPDAQTS